MVWKGWATFNDTGTDAQTYYQTPHHRRGSQSSLNLQRSKSYEFNNNNHYFNEYSIAKNGRE